MNEERFKAELDAYFRAGWRVFPVKYREKTPLTPHGFKDAVRTRPDFETLCGGQSETNIGFPTGCVNDVFVIDFDYTHGGGIVADSVPAAEYQETLDKARALLEAIDLARSP